VTPALVLGPVLFNWPPETLRDFYARMADEAPVDIVHVGEVVCVKRWPFLAPHLPDIIERLQAGGKQVVISTFSLISTEREMAVARSLATGSDLPVEINDLAVAPLMGGKPHVIGPGVNIYNEATLAFFERRGAARICLPPELPASALAALAHAANATLEVQVFGRIPLAISSRCFHARAHGLQKDGCQFVCGNDPDGLPVDTLDAESFLAVNGTQALSHSCANLAGEIGALKDMGFAAFRLSPQACDMVAVARVFAAAASDQIAAEEAQARIAQMLPHMKSSNGFFHGGEGRRFAALGSGGE
jgi:collagenase-like PrtC family protease